MNLEYIPEEKREFFKKYASLFSKAEVIEKSQSKSYCTCMLIKCRHNGKLIRESDGQFTGGWWEEVYHYEGNTYCFVVELKKGVQELVVRKGLE